MTCYALCVTTTNIAPVSRRRVYDARVRELVYATGNPRLFPELNIPESTIRGWINGEFRTAVGTESVLKNFWLYLNVLNTEAAVRRLVAFYVQQYNELMPHSALDFRTPDEVYFRTCPASSRMHDARHAKLA